MTRQASGVRKRFTGVRDFRGVLREYPVVALGSALPVSVPDMSRRVLLSVIRRAESVLAGWASALSPAVPTPSHGGRYFVMGLSDKEREVLALAETDPKWTPDSVAPHLKDVVAAVFETV